jgi:hypothetical protein
MKRLVGLSIAAAFAWATLLAPPVTANPACSITERAFTVSSGSSPSIYGAITVRNKTGVWQYAEVDYKVTDSRGRNLLTSGTATGAIPPRKSRTIVYDGTLGALFAGNQKVSLKPRCSKVTTKVGLVSGDAVAQEDEYGFVTTSLIFDNRTRYPVSDFQKVHIAVRDGSGRLVSGCWGFPNQVIPPGMRVADTGIYCSDESFRPPGYRLQGTVASVPG